MLLALLAGAVLCLPTAAPAMAAQQQKPQASGPCGTEHNAKPHYKHVIWLFMENQPYDDIIGGADSPYVNQLADECGLATNYHNITHPSAPNYLAVTSGQLGGADDCTPSQCPQNTDNIFAQITRAHKTWTTFAEGMSGGNCQQGPLDSGWAPPYDVNHNPPVYYPSLAADCQKYDVPMGDLTSGAFADALKNGLPDFSFVAPDICHDTHSCPISVGDQWLQQTVAAITNSDDYRDGSTALFLTWDEGEHGNTSDCAYNTTDVGCHVATIVVSPSTRPGTESDLLFNHYSLLKTTEELLNLHGRLGHAADPQVLSMKSAFRL
ncbi:alkaline phosphatase family protein [Catenulispora sp. GP43]|uniref:alkaline phosphatase family protein n=1 Tax=Catenulispora sp. GP43 TaxID=3156263 RepID=UPI00351115D0